MKRTFGAMILLVVLAGAAMAQQPQGPVSRSEASAILKRVGTALKIFTGGKGKPYTASLPATGTLTRTELVREFDRIFETAKPFFKFTPKRVGYDASVLSLTDAEARKRLDKLVSWGCVARLGPLATNPKDELGLAEFGDAVGFMLMRVAELTHTPSSKWTPAMMHGGD